MCLPPIPKKWQNVCNFILQICVMWKLSSVIAILCLILMACRTGKESTASESNDSDIISITHGTSFGMCRGYCIKEEYYTKDTLIETQRSMDTARYKAKVNGFDFPADKFQDLCETIDLKKWDKLEERIGCPDCTDRGAEYLIITTKKGTKKVTFDAHADVPGLTEVLKKLRDKRKELEHVPFMETE